MPCFNRFFFGPMNDVVTIFHFALSIPAAVTLHRYFRVVEPRLSRTALGANLVGVGVVVVFQTLLVTGVMTFLESLGYVLIGGILFGAWILMVGKMGRATGILPLSRRLSVLAVLYVGYPVWAVMVGRFLNNSSRSSMKIPQRKEELAK